MVPTPSSYLGKGPWTHICDASRHRSLEARVTRFKFLAAAGLLITAFPQLAAAQPPGPPPNLVASATGSAVSLRWETPASGAPPTTYFIEAGSASTLSDVARFATGGTVPSFSAAGVAEGTYYVRVRALNAFGMSAPSNEVTLAVGRSRNANPQVRTSTVKLTEDMFGDAVVVGEVQNFGAGMATFVRVFATLLGSAGQGVGFDGTYAEGRVRRLNASRIITGSTLAEGETGCFIMFTNVPRRTVSSVTLRTEFDTFETEPLSGRVDLAGVLRPSATAFGQLRVDGQVVNLGPRFTYLNNVVITVRNASGQLVDCDSTWAQGSPVTLPIGVTTQTGLVPGQVGAFTAFSSAQLSSVTAITHWLRWAEDETPAAGQTSLGVSAQVTGLPEQYAVLHGQLAALAEHDPRVVDRKTVARYRNRLEEIGRQIEASSVGSATTPSTTR